MAFAPAPLPHLSLVLEATPAAQTIATAVPLPHLSTLFEYSGKLVAEAGIFSVSGSDRTFLIAARFLRGDASSYAMTGVAATPYKGSTNTGVEAPAPLPHLSFVLQANPGAKYVVCAAGAYGMTGVAATMRKGLGISAEAGSYALSGAPALRDMEMNGSSGSYAMTGVAAGLMIGRLPLTAAAGSYAMTGRIAGLTYEQPGVRVLTASQGQFRIDTDVRATLSVNTRVLSAAAGAYAMTGRAANVGASVIQWRDVYEPVITWSTVPDGDNTWTAV